MASFKPTKVQVYPKLGEKVTQDTLYWKNYKVCFLCFSLHAKFEPGVIHLYHYLINVFFVFSQPPIQIKEFGAITSIDFSPVAPHNFAVTAFSRVSRIFLCIHYQLFFTVLSTNQPSVVLPIKNVPFQIHIYSAFSQEPVKSFTRFKDTAYSGRFRSDGQLLVAGCEDKVVRLFDVSGKAALRMFKGHTK